MITVVEWSRYSLNIKYFKTLKQVKQYAKENPGHCIVAVRGKVLYKSNIIK